MVPDLYPGKAGYPGMNLQTGATLQGRVAAIGPEPVHGARHDAHPYAASGHKDLLAGRDATADLGYPGVDGITTTPYRKPPGCQLPEPDATFNKELSAIRAAAEHAAAHVKTWRMPSGQGGRYTRPSANTARCLPPSSACSSSAITGPPNE